MGLLLWGGGGYYYGGGAIISKKPIRSRQFSVFFNNCQNRENCIYFWSEKSLIIRNVAVILLDNFVILVFGVSQKMFFFIWIFLEFLLFLRCCSLQHLQTCLTLATGFEDGDFVILTTTQRKADAASLK